MRINFEKLRDDGFIVVADKDGVDIRGSQEFPFEETRRFLRPFCLTNGQTDQVIDDLACAVELHQIFNALK